MTRIECVKHWIKDDPDVRPIIMIHVGANQFVWQTYKPELMMNRLTLLDNQGKIKKAMDSKETYDIAGPLCFQVKFILLNLI